MRKQVHDPESYVVVPAENTIEDHLFGDEFAGVGDRYLSVAGSHGDPGKYPRTNDQENVFNMFMDN
jgi:hypothetical protein